MNYYNSGNTIRILGWKGRRPSMFHAVFHARRVDLNPRLKRSAERAFAALGISSTEAIRHFSKQVELHRGLPYLFPFPMRKPPLSGYNDAVSVKYQITLRRIWQRS
jgi:antitoxin component of RelBE/YafQ-DinJ toxin-antitoxin module